MRRRLHEDIKTDLKNGYSSEHAQHSKDKGANRVSDVPSRLTVNDDCSNDHSNTLNDVSY